MSCREAGRRGGEVTRRRMGPDHYPRLGRMGGERVKALVAKGKQLEESDGSEPASEA